MPELPEVETVTKVITPIIKDRTITAIDVIRNQNIVGDPKEFVSSLLGEKFLSLTRVGKYLIFHLTHNKVIISHLRMEGKYYEYLENEHNSPYAKLVYHFDNGHKLCYDDSRGFGILKLSSEDAYMKEKEIAKLGPEPFYVTDVTHILEQCKNRNEPIKTALLSQELITGLGNIYVDETLFLSKVHPHTPAKLIDKTTMESIVKNASEVMKKAILAGGSTIKSYHPGKDIDGKFQNNLLVYGKANQKCPVCGSTLRFIKTNGRGTTFCPKCQPKLGKPIIVGLTGKIASGKSLALRQFASEGFFTVSCDEIVHNLYEDKNIVKKVNFKLGIPGEDLDKQAIREKAGNDKNRVILQNILFPYVIQEVTKQLKASKSPIKVVEAPLLFDAKMDDIFDSIVVIVTPQNENLSIKRDGSISEALRKINKNTALENNISKAEFVINNDGTKEEFITKIQALINTLKSRLD